MITPIEQAHLDEIVAQGKGRGAPLSEIAAIFRAAADLLDPSGGLVPDQADDHATTGEQKS